MAEPSAILDAPRRERLLCLDAFRGFVIAAMLLVNMTWNSDSYQFHPQLSHVPFNTPDQGATLTDLVFPWFLFIAGCAIPLSMKTGRGRSRSARQKLLVAVRRGAVIYLLGVLLTVAGKAYSTPVTWKDLFGWNILQLIGVGYICAVAVYLLPRKGQVVFVGLVLAVKLLLLTLIPADFLRAAMDTAGFAPRVSGGSPTGAGTFTHFDDVKRFMHLEHVKALHLKDDAGFWSTFGVYCAGWLGMSQQFLPCAAIAVMGGWCLEILTDQSKVKGARVARLALFGSSALTLCYLFQAGYNVNGGGWLGGLTVPFSKWLFSPSYCLLAAGTGAILLAMFYLLTDLFRVTQLSVLRIFGLNAIAVYVCAELSFKVVFAKWQIIYPNGFSGAVAGGLISWVGYWSDSFGMPSQVSLALGAWSLPLTWILVWWLLCYWLWRRQIVVKL